MTPSTKQSIIVFSSGLHLWVIKHFPPPFYLSPASIIGLMWSCWGNTLKSLVQQITPSTYFCLKFEPYSISSFCWTAKLLGWKQTNTCVLNGFFQFPSGTWGFNQSEACTRWHLSKMLHNGIALESMWLDASLSTACPWLHLLHYLIQTSLLVKLLLFYIWPFLCV